MYITESVGINIFPPSLNFTLSSIFLEHDLKIMTFLTTLRDNILDFNHWESFFRSWFIFLARSTRDELDCRIFVWLAKRYNLGCFIHLSRSFVCIRKKIGLKTEPWGTPAMIFFWFLNNNFLYQHIAFCCWHTMKTSPLQSLTP